MMGTKIRHIAPCQISPSKNPGGGPGSLGLVGVHHVGFPR
jgi:hypothetical protein